jgi:hypothetical protein
VVFKHTLVSPDAITHEQLGLRIASALNGEEIGKDDGFEIMLPVINLFLAGGEKCFALSQEASKFFNQSLLLEPI